MSEKTISKKKSFFKSMGKYLRELSVVVMGIAITLTASNWISSRSEKNDLNMYLDAVKLELEDNLQLAKNRTEYFTESSKFANYLNSNSPEKLSVDSIQKYRRVTHSFSHLTYKSSAFEMLKISGSMRLIKDKNTMQDIWSSYSSLEQVKLESDHYMQNKADLILNTMLNKTEMKTELDIRQPENRKLLIFYTNGVDHSLKVQFEKSVIQLEQTLEKF